MLQHRQRTDHDPGLRDHAPVDPLHNHIIIDILLAVLYDLVLPFLDFGHPRNTTRTAELLLHTDEDHRQDAALPWFLDVIDLTQDHVPRHLVVALEAAKSYYDQLHAHPIRPTSPLLMLMTPGANGTIVTTPTTTITNTTRPNSPAGPPPSEPSTNPPSHTTAPLGAVAFRVPDGDSENSEVTDAISISKFDTNDIDLSEMVEAANDPLRVRCLTELDPDHTVPLRQSLNQSTMQLFNQFVDEMFHQLAQPYRTVNNQLVLYQSKPSHRQEHCQGLCTIQLTGHRAGEANQSVLHRAREPADHHGPNGIAQETDLSWRAHGHLPDLPQNELGNSCQDPRGRLHSPGNLDKKTKPATRLIPMLRVLRHVLGDS